MNVFRLLTILYFLKLSYGFKFEASTYLQYLNAKNISGWAVIQKLPIFGFAWRRVYGFTSKKIDKIVKERQERGCFRNRCRLP